VGLPNLLGRFPSSPNLYLPQYLPM
jgi:hypothetical protein